jgi:predicted AlkP superfamily pyrophosphatase or phosphodiesterase
MQKTAVLNIVGLTPALLGEHMPFLTEWASTGAQASIEPVLPAVTCSVQSTYLTGEMPSEHGIVGNGWYFRDECEVKFWRQSNKLVQAPKIWEEARERDSEFTCANLFWWYNMYSSVDVAVTPRPMYPSDGRKIPDVYTQPSELRFHLQEKLGQFPLFEFWGPNTSIHSSEWIAEAAKHVDEQFDPTLSLVYLPHLDYNFQRLGPQDPEVAGDLREIDRVCEDLISFYEARDANVVVLSEYGITTARRGVSLNRILREEGYIEVREELGRELLDAGACGAFAVADHQLAHIYVRDREEIRRVRQLIESAPGVDRVLGAEGKAEVGLDHPRSGELVALAEPDAWFTYYYWMDDERAPDFARTVAIHDKPGYDPVELFVDPEILFPKMKAGYRLAQKKLGFRYLMDLIPLDPSLVGGTHGRLPDSPADGPLLITQQPDRLPGDELEAVEVYDVLLRHLLAG